MKENIDIFDFELSDDEMNIINSIDKNISKFNKNTLEGLEYIKK